MLKRIALLVLLTISFTGLFAQTKTVSMLNIQQLEKRISNADTIYIVNFWATWFGPFVKELPNFDQLQTTLKNQPVKVLLVSMDFKSKLKVVNTFAQSRKLMSEVFLADRSNDQQFIDAIDKNWIGALPGTLVVNTKKHFRKFYEQEFTYTELNKLYQTNK